MKRLRPLSIDFGAGRPPPSRWGVALLGAGLVAGAAAALDYLAAADELARLAQRELSLERRAGRASAPAGTTAAATQAAEAARQLKRPWDALLRDLERALGDAEAAGGGVALLSVEPDAAQRQLRITGEARQLADILAFVGRLEGAPSLQRPTLAGHRARQSDGVPVVEFSVVAGWTAG